MKWFQKLKDKIHGFLAVPGDYKPLPTEILDALNEVCTRYARAVSDLNYVGFNFLDVQFRYAQISKKADMSDAEYTQARHQLDMLWNEIEVIRQNLERKEAEVDAAKKRMDEVKERANNYNPTTPLIFQGFLKLKSNLSYRFLLLKKRLHVKLKNVNVSFSYLKDPVNKAIALLPSNPGGCVSLLEGQYNIAASITDQGKNNGKLKGQGWGTILRLVNAANTHVIHLTTVNYWMIEDLQVDGNKANQTAIGDAFAGIHVADSTHCTVQNCLVINCYNNGAPGLPARAYGIFFYNSTNCNAFNNTTLDCDWGGVGFYSGSDHGKMSGNWASGHDHCGFQAAFSDYCLIQNNNGMNNELATIIGHQAEYTNIIGNICIAGADTDYGILFAAEDISCRYSIVALNIIAGAHDIDGIRFDAGNYNNTINGNIIVLPDANGINMFQGNAKNAIINNVILGAGAWGIILTADVDDSWINGNWTIANTSGGLRIAAASCDDNRVGVNFFTEATAISDAGTGTKLPSLVVPFVDGTDPQDSGYLIDGGGDLARTFHFLPLRVQQVVRMKIYARSVVLEADEMRSEFVIYGAASNQIYTTHNGSVANHPSTTGNFAADDIIYWVITEAGLLAMVGGDSIQIKVLHEDAGGGDCETNAYFRTVEIEYG